MQIYLLIILTIVAAGLAGLAFTLWSEGRGLVGEIERLYSNVDDLHGKLAMLQFENNDLKRQCSELAQTGTPPILTSIVKDEVRGDQQCD